MEEMYNEQTEPQASQVYREEPIKLGEWLRTFLILLVPVLNIVMIFVWAFSRKGKKSKSNFFKAYLLFMLILIGLYLLLIIGFGLSAVSLAG